MDWLRCIGDWSTNGDVLVRVDWLRCIGEGVD